MSQKQIAKVEEMALAIDYLVDAEVSQGPHIHMYVHTQTQAATPATCDERSERVTHSSLHWLLHSINGHSQWHSARSHTAPEACREGEQGLVGGGQIDLCKDESE